MVLLLNSDFLLLTCKIISEPKSLIESGEKSSTLSAMRVLGIDCGTECTGYGIVEMSETDHLNCLGFGGIKVRSSDPMPHRLASIFETLRALIQEHQPDRVAIEDVFYAVNAKSALKLGQVRGIAMLAASASGIHVT